MNDAVIDENVQQEVEAASGRWVVLKSLRIPLLLKWRSSEVTIDESGKPNLCCMFSRNDVADMAHAMLLQSSSSRCLRWRSIAMAVDTTTPSERSRLAVSAGPGHLGTLRGYDSVSFLFCREGWRIMGVRRVCVWCGACLYVLAALP